MSQKAQKLVIDSTNVVELKGLRDEVTGDYIDDATVKVTILDADNVAVTGADNLTMAHVAGTTGKATEYRGTIPADVVLTEGVQYTAKVVATKDASVRTFPVPATAVDLP